MYIFELGKNLYQMKKKQKRYLEENKIHFILEKKHQK